jgi:hypothetical protein
MESSKFLRLAKYYSGDYIKLDEMNWKRSIHEGGEKWIQNCNRKNLRKEISCEFCVSMEG